MYENGVINVDMYRLNGFVYEAFIYIDIHVDYNSTLIGPS